MSFSLAVDVAAPYPGLRPFLRDESVIFFGRDQQIDDVLARLKAHQFLGIVGTSGCGKSSLVRAGMLPALASGLMGELGSTWFVADMKPGDAPLTNLAKALIKSGVLGQRWSDTPEGIALLTAALRRSDVSLVNLVRQLELPPYTNLLVLADQFEEIFRFQQQDPHEALAFVNLLLESGRDRSERIYVVLTMRTDFLGQCALFPGLPEALNDSQYLCPRLSRDQLAKAIEGPASVFGATVERPLVTKLLNDSGLNSDQLPLVQHALARMWNTRPSPGRGPDPDASKIVLRLRDYERIGGLNGSFSNSSQTTTSASWIGDSREHSGIGLTRLRGQNALSQHADEAYFALADAQHESRVDGPDHKPSRKQLIAQMLFRSLAERGISGAYVRRPMKLQNVADIAGCSVPELITVVEVFRTEDRSFLVPPVGTALTEDSVLDISHEALIRQWERFGGQSDSASDQANSQSWLAIEDQARRRYRRLAEAADSEATAGLLKDPELSFLDKWWNEFQPSEAWANGCVKDSFQRTQTFLDKSRTAVHEDSLRQQAQQQERLRLTEQLAEEQTNRAKAFQELSGVIALVAVCALVLSIVAWRAKESATAATESARDALELANENAAAAKRNLAASLAAQSAAVRKELPVKSVLLTAVAVKIWKDPPVVSAEQNLRDSLQNLGGVALNGHEGAVNVVVISPDGRWLVTSSDDKTARLWDLQAKEPEKTVRVLRGHEGAIIDADISPEGRWLVTGSAYTARVWDLQAEEPEKTARVVSVQHADGRVDIGPNGRWLVTRGDNSRARLWDLQAKEPEKTSRVIGGDIRAVHRVGISPDGRWLVVTGSDDDMTAWLWDLQAKEPEKTTRVLSGHKGSVDALAISPHGRWLVTGGDDMTARLWDLQAKEPEKTARVMTGHDGAVISAVISPDGRWLVTGSSDKTARLWDLQADEPETTTRVLRGHENPVVALVISSDGRWLVTGGFPDTTARLWDLQAKEPETTARVLRGHEDAIFSVAISPDGRWLVTDSADKTVRLWDLQAKALEMTARVMSGHEGGVRDLAISPDGRWLVTGSSDKTARLWDLHANEPEKTTRVLRGQESTVNAEAISPDGRWLVTGSDDTTARLWDLQDEEPENTVRILRGHEGAVRHVAISSDGRWLVTSSDDKTARLWDLRTKEPEKSARVLSGHGVNVSAIAISFDARWLVTGSGDGTVWLWDLQAKELEKTARILCNHESYVSDLIISPNGRWLITSNNHETTVRLWDLHANEPEKTARIFSGHENIVTAVAISPNGRWLVTGSLDRTARLWDLQANEPEKTARVFSGHENIVTAVAISPNGRWLVTGSGYTALLWDLQAKEPDKTFRVLSHTSFIRAAAISPDGRWLVTGSADTTARLWDLHANDPQKTARVLTGHNDEVTAVVISPDGRWLVTGSKDGTCRVWSLSLDVLLNQAKRAVGRNLTLAEWEEIFPGEAYRETFPGLPSPVAPAAISK